MEVPVEVLVSFGDLLMMLLYFLVISFVGSGSVIIPDLGCTYCSQSDEHM